MGEKWDLIVKCVRIKQESHDSEFDLAEKQSRKHDLYMFFKKRVQVLYEGIMSTVQILYICVFVFCPLQHTSSATRLLGKI